jgi:hypothetical protein
MAIGPGKYDHLASFVRKWATAKAVVLIVVDGDKGSGFSVQAHGDIASSLPVLLRRIADDIEEGLG